MSSQEPTFASPAEIPQAVEELERRIAAEAAEAGTDAVTAEDAVAVPGSGEPPD